MLRYILPAHPYHMVTPSPWPFTISWAAFSYIITFALRYLYGSKTILLLITHKLSLVCLLAILYLWWQDIIQEAAFEGAHTEEVQRGLKFGFLLFIFSEIMLFFSFFWAFFAACLSPPVQIGTMWPPEAIETPVPLTIPLWNTMILVTSGFLITWAHYAVVLNYATLAIYATLGAYYLALWFTSAQLYEYEHLPFTISDSIYGSTFYMLTGLHGMHVIVGTIFIAVAFCRLCEEHFSQTHHVGLELAIWYWHFVDIVWLGLYLFVYIWGNNVLFPRSLESYSDEFPYNSL